MRSRSAVGAAVIACAVLLPAVSAAQQPQRGFVRDVLAPALWGGLAGLGLGVAHIDSEGEGWLLSDETALPMAVAAGMATAFLVRHTSSGLEPSAARRPRLRVAVGTGSGMDWDYSLGYRAPAGDRFDVDGAILVVNDTWERTEAQTRCPGLFGCVSGNFIVDYRYQQSVSAVVRGVYRLRPSASWNPTVALGGGPALTHVQLYERSAYRRAGISLDGALAVERGGRRRWTAEAGFRVIPIGGSEEATIDDPMLYVRLGLAWAP